MVLLDTNVVSELMRPNPAPRVEAWLARRIAASVFISVISEAEIRYGAAILPAGKRRDTLITAIEDMFRRDFAGRVLPFDSAAAAEYASIATARRHAGRPISQSDCQIAAIARSRGAEIATRDSGGFTDCGIDVINPWDG